jgi:hypothetical protein
MPADEPAATPYPIGASAAHATTIAHLFPNSYPFPAAFGIRPGVLRPRPPGSDRRIVDEISAGVMARSGV